MPYEDNVGDNFSSDMSYRNVGCGFNINESTKYAKIGPFKKRLLMISWLKCCSQKLTETWLYISPRNKAKIVTIQCSLWIMEHRITTDNKN